MTVPIATTSRSKTVIFFGDSITEQALQPKGYITVLDSIVNGKNKPRYILTGKGISGNKVYDLYLRMEKDVLVYKPAIVFIYIGVNDVWHKQLLRTGTDADKFERFYVAIVKKFAEQKIKTVLCTPAVIGEKWDGNNAMDADLNKYSGIIRTLAKTYNCPLVDLRTAFTNYYITHNPDNKDKGILTTDGVHLNDAGNALVAQQMALHL